MTTSSRRIAARAIATLLLMMCLPAPSGAAVAVDDPLIVTALRCAHARNPLGLEAPHPGLSWTLAGEGFGRTQTAYQVLVATAPESLAVGVGDVWDTGKVAGRRSIHVPYEGPALRSRTRYYWTVRVWDEEGRPGPYAEPGWWEMGLLRERDWSARWISAATVADSLPSPAPLLRTGFSLEAPVARARLYVSGLGYYEAYLNGEKVGDHVLDPAVTRYDRRVKYAVYDVTAALREGENVLGVVLGNGWYNQHTRSAWDFDRAPWRAPPSVLAQLEVTFADGARQVVATDERWRTHDSAIVFDGIRNGETYDARRVQAGWASPGFDDGRWEGVHVVNGPAGRLSAQLMPPIRVVDTRYPVRVDKPVPGVHLYDFGQNLSGWIDLRVSGPAGAEVVIRYGERLRADGTLDQQELARFIWSGDTQTDRYILAGEGSEAWHPRFVYHGFQYAELIPSSSDVELEVVAAHVVHTDFDRAGTFDAEDALVDRIQHNFEWSFLGNYHGYPTDCPHREKIGWSGDAHLAARAGLFNFEAATAYLKWLDDFVDEQRPSGQLPGIVPTSGWGYTYGRDDRHRARGYGPQWEGAFPLIAWDLYRFTGDASIPTRHYDAMKGYVDYLGRHAEDDVLHFGIDDHKWIEVQTEAPILATGHFFEITRIVARTAALMGRDAEAARYDRQAAKIRDAFNRHFFDPETGSYGNGSQTPLAGALYHGLVPPEQEQRVLENLVREIERRDGHFITGVVGTRYVLDVLLRYGYDEVAFAAVTATDFPGWGYWIARGATTLWQNWDGSQSRNHVMFGSVGDWLYRALAGLRIDPDHPGFARTIVRPPLLEALAGASARHASPYGEVASAWRRDGGRFVLDVDVPVNATALVHVPGVVTQATDAARFVGREGDRSVYAVGSGTYRFVSRLDG